MNRNVAPHGSADAALVRVAACFIGRALTTHEGLLILGICGAQGSGKSTLAAALAAEMAGRDVATACLSLDDLYLGRAERAQLARDIHPLFRTRGVPGTHDVALGLRLIRELRAGRAVQLPRFDKARDEPWPKMAWPMAPAATRLLLLEGWCVGARPQPCAALVHPVNMLEQVEDPDGRWRRHWNCFLAGHYQTLFAEIDCLLMLKAPGFDVVARWRHEQEQAIPVMEQRMSMEEVERFIQHFERLTRWILESMPASADMVVPLDRGRKPSLTHTLYRQHLDPPGGSA